VLWIRIRAWIRIESGFRRAKINHKNCVGKERSLIGRTGSLMYRLPSVGWTEVVDSSWGRHVTFGTDPSIYHCLHYVTPSGWPAGSSMACRLQTPAMRCDTLGLTQGIKKRCLVYLGWPIAHSYMSPNAGGKGRACEVSAIEYSARIYKFAGTAVHNAQLHMEPI